MFKPINTYTKKDIIWYLKTFNTGKKSYSQKNYQCSYKAGSNHCAIGCFIPHGHEGMKSAADVNSLLMDFPDLEEKMPLDIEALEELQCIHDFNPNNPHMHIAYQYTRIRNVQKRMIQWVEDNVEEV